MRSFNALAGIRNQSPPRSSGRARDCAPSRKPLFNAAIFKERFNTIERVFGWEDKFRRLLLRFERLSQLHYAFKTLAYTMINLRHFCQG
jgi:transposase